MQKPIEIHVFSDCLCPWCYIATVRLLKIKEEYGDGVSVTWRSYPLRFGTPAAGFRKASNEGRLRAGAEEKSIVLNPWPENKAIPVSSFPALEVTKCAGLQGVEAFDRLHLLIMQAYFADCQDIGQSDVLIALAKEAGLDMDRLILDLDSGSQREQILADYNEYNEKYVGWGVPTAVFGEDIVLAGAVPIEMYRQAIKAASRSNR